MRFANQCPLQPINHVGRGSSHHLPSFSDQVPTIFPAPLTKQPLPWASTISPGSVTSVSIPSCSSLSTSPTPELFFPLDSLSTWPLILSPSPPSPLYVRACPPPLTPSSAPPPSGSKLSLNQGDSMALTLGTMCHRSSPHSPVMAASQLCLLKQSCINLAWCQETTKPWSFSTLTYLEFQQEHLPLYPPEASFWETPQTGR